MLIYYTYTYTFSDTISEDGNLNVLLNCLLGPISSFKFDVGLYFYEQLYEILRTVMLSMWYDYEIILIQKKLNV